MEANIWWGDVSDGCQSCQKVRVISFFEVLLPSLLFLLQSLMLSNRNSLNLHSGYFTENNQTVRKYALSHRQERLYFGQLSSSHAVAFSCELKQYLIRWRLLIDCPHILACSPQFETFMHPVNIYSLDVWQRKQNITHWIFWGFFSLKRLLFFRPQCSVECGLGGRSLGNLSQQQQSVNHTSSPVGDGAACTDDVTLRHQLKGERWHFTQASLWLT